MFSLPISVKRSVTVDKPISEVYRFVGDFKNWRFWSPWLCQEPSCPVDVRAAPCAPGHTQSWDGNYIGAGNMTIASLKASEFIDYTLYFLKPWKFTSDVKFQFEEESSSKTKVTWSMNTTIPIFLFFLRKSMETWLGSDYERGLGMLKYYLEIGPVPSILKVKAEPTPQEAFSWLGIHRQCSLEEMPERMSADFKHLFDSDLGSPKFPFSFYHKYDLRAGGVEYTSALAFEKERKHKEFKSGNVDFHSAFIVEHKGPYRFLGNAWAAASSLQRTCKRAHKKIPMYEVYVNQPGEVAEDELITRIIIPLR